MTPRRALIAFALCAASLGARGPGGAADAAPAPADTAYHGGRRAIIEVGLPRREPTALDSIPHPWPGRALLFSAVGTALPIVVATLPSDASNDSRRATFLTMLALEIVTPAAGHLYARIPREAVAGIVVRGLGFAILASGAGEIYHGGSDGGVGVFQVLGGGALMAVSALWDTATVPTKVERANRERLRQRAALGVRPALDGEPVALVVRLRF